MVRLSETEAASPVRAAPTAVVVVVPVHDEERLLSRCLHSVRRAAHNVPIPVRVVVVLDSCADNSAHLVPPSAATVRIDARNVGAARAAGFAFAAEEYGGGERLWYSTTDADSSVPTDWFTAQLAHARAADVTAGTIAVRWRERTATVRAEYERRYHRHTVGGHHRHVHGANLGFRAAWYHRVGGFAPKSVDEDVDLVTRLHAAGARIAWIDHPAVATSDRHDNRVRGGFAGYLTNLASTSPD
ncbi:glycosyltransferase [Nocardia sp. NPDC005366]|uniref:glycosyltransferase n=1 Tax=Nocardia sp. NPDC005366 TaxID=3156878 RepID=UPI0033A229BF